MKKVNPLIIPRNHLVEEALKKASEKDDFKKLKQLLKILQEPYKKFQFISDYQKFPIKGFKNYKTFVVLKKYIYLLNRKEVLKLYL